MISTRKGVSGESMENFQDILPRSIFAESQQQQERLDKTGASFIGITGDIAGGGSNYMNTGDSMNIMRHPSRRFYDPQITTTAIYLPRTIKQKNRWRRWFFDHDELIGAVLELHAELPYSKFELMLDDPMIKRHIEDCFDKTNFFSMLPLIDLEYMKIGEVFINTPWDDSLGMWSHIIVHNPDFVELTYTPFADQQSVIELIPDNELKSLVHSTDPQEQQLKRRLPSDILRRVLTGRNIVLNPEEVTHIARRSNPYDIRGTSIIDRIFRTLLYEDKLREAQITIADNFIYPLKIYKLGDPNKGWIPNDSHQKALAQMLQQAAFDPNFSLIYHYGLNVEYMTVADKVMRLEPEWNEINQKKMIGLGVSQQFITGETTYASANVGLQTQLARYRAKRDLFEIAWIRDKFLRVMAQRNEWYKRDAREIVGQFRVKRKGAELEERLIVPKLVWHKKLMMRDDQAFLTFMNNVYSQNKGPISAYTLVQSMGFDLEDELERKKLQKKIEEKVGEYIQPPSPSASPLGIGAAFKKWRDKTAYNKVQKKLAKELAEIEELRKTQKEDKEFVGKDSPLNSVEGLNSTEAEQFENEYIEKTSNEFVPVPLQQWVTNLKAPLLPPEVVVLFNGLENRIESFSKNNVDKDITYYIDAISEIFTKLYMQGKLFSYNFSGFLPIYQQHYSQDGSIKDYSDELLLQEFQNWLLSLLNNDNNLSLAYKAAKIRNYSNCCFSIGQLKGYEEQGIHWVKACNVLDKDGHKFNVDNLLAKGKNVAFLVSPKNEIILFIGCIQGFTEDEFANSLDPNIKTHQDITLGGVSLQNVPIEYIFGLRRIFEKLGTKIKKKYDKIIFTNDIIDLSQWEDFEKKRIAKENEHIKNKATKDLMITNTLTYEKFQKRGTIKKFGDGKTLYISSWIGVEDQPITISLLESLDLFDDSFYKNVNSSFEVINHDLTPDELNTYAVFEYIEPLIEEDTEEVSGFRITEKALENRSTIDKKVVEGKLWSKEGKCLTPSDSDPVHVFKSNLHLWINYSHLLDKQTLQNFDKIMR